jgi:DNA-binding NtrC family response regulator
MTTDRAVIAIIDDEADMRASVSQLLGLTGFDPVSFETADAALELLNASFPGAVVSDIRMPGMDGMALLRRLQSIDPGLPVILMTGHGDVPLAVEAMRIGAFDFIEKPFEPEHLTDLCRRAAETRARALETRALRREMSDENVLDRQLMGASPVVEKLRETILDAAQADGHVLILGETGTGKSLIAKALHASGPRASKPMLTLNCASLDDSAFEESLFGGEGWSEKPLLIHAEGGTLCFEDIDALSPASQSRLLDVCNMVSASQPGAEHNVRIVATSSRLNAADPPVDGMREDLYFRLAGLTIEAPALRVRGEDILSLFSHFMVGFADEYGCGAPALTAGDAANLVQAPWPGNIRQLINLAERAVLQSRRGENNISALLIDDGFEAPAIDIDADKPLKEHVEAFEKMLIDHALRRNRGSVATVMTELALPRRTLNEKMVKYGLSRSDYL